MNIYWKLKRPPKMFLATISRNGKEETSLYYDFATLYKDTFSPETEIVNFIPFQVSGRFFSEKQNSLRKTAIEFLKIDYNQAAELTGKELSIIHDFFEKNGRRYGMVKELRYMNILL